MQHQFKSTAITIISAVLIFLFVYTALSKYLEFGLFKAVLYKSPLIGDKAIIVALGLPLIELVVAALLFLEKTRVTGLYTAMILLLVFTAYILYMLLFVPNLPCSCGGILKQMNWTEHLIFNILLSVLAGTGVALQKINKTYTPREGA